jgi:hypothetical protein
VFPDAEAAEPFIVPTEPTEAVELTVPVVSLLLSLSNVGAVTVLVASAYVEIVAACSELIVANTISKPDNTTDALFLIFITCSPFAIQLNVSAHYGEL